MSKVTRKMALELIKQITPWKYTDIPEPEAQAIRDRVEAEKLQPIDEGMSLHAWNADYMIDGIRYQLIGELGSHTPPDVMKMERWFVD